MTDTEDTDDVPRPASRTSKGKGKKTDAGRKKPRVPDQPPPKEAPTNYRTIPALAAYVTRIADGREVEQRNFRSIAILGKSEGGYRRDLFTIRLKRDGTIVESKDHEPPAEEEQTAIKEAFSKITLPRSVPVLRRTADDHRDKLGVNREDWFVLLDGSRKNAVMCQQRVDNKDGTKSYLPWTWWSDGEWRQMEPDEAPLPLWKPEKNRNKARIMIHEGAKAARHVDWLVNDVEAREARARHPWVRELSIYEHWGWIGGAHRPTATDWEEVAREKPIKVVLVCDNDEPGTEAAPVISRILKLSMDSVRFDERFKSGHDLAEDLPAEFWKGERYTGPSLDDVTLPATWATDVVHTDEKGRPPIKLRKEFVREWLRSITPDAFVHERHTNRILSEKQFNKLVGPFSDAADTARLFTKHLPSLCNDLAYFPGNQSGVVAREGLRSINTFRPSSVVSIQGDAQPWLDFMTRLIPDEGDRGELLRWCSTLVALLRVKMRYGVLLVSKTQGVGKGTLAHILAALVGRHNTSFPTEAQIVNSGFNSWMAHRRLAVADEIYSGQSRKAYDRLKSVITEPVITVNRKFVEEYQVDNYVHVFASSNSMRALHLDDEDRRWLVPRVTEERQPEEYWVDLYDWLAVDGLGIVRHWMEEYIGKQGVPVGDGERAPSTTLKREIIEASRSEGQQLARDLGELVAQMEKKVVLAITDVREWVASMRGMYNTNDRHLESPLTLRNELKAAGLKEPMRSGDHDGRFPIDRTRKSHVVANFEIAAGVSWSEIKEHYVRPEVIWPTSTGAVRNGRIPM